MPKHTSENCEKQALYAYEYGDHSKKECTLVKLYYDGFDPIISTSMSYL